MPATFTPIDSSKPAYPPTQRKPRVKRTCAALFAWIAVAWIALACVTPAWVLAEPIQPIENDDSEVPATREDLPQQAEKSEEASEDNIPEANTAEGAHRSLFGTEPPWSGEPLKSVAEIAYPDRDGSQPEWLEKERWSEGNQQFVAVASKVQMNKHEAEQMLDVQIQEAVDDHVDRLLEPGAAAQIGYEVDEIRRRCLAEKVFIEKVVFRHGASYQAHALLSFDDAFEEDLVERWHAVVASKRLIQTGLGAGAVLLLLSTLFGYFKLDTATRGYYTGRLQFAAFGAILALVAAAILVSKWIPGI